MDTTTTRQCLVIGHGRAGNARVRTIQNHPHFSLLKHIPARSFSPHNINPSTLTFVCSDNKSHYQITKSLLSIGCDVIVEFPPCHSLKQWKELHNIATTQSALLHCALIGLYTHAHKQRKEWLQNHPIQNIHTHFTGGLYRWVQEEALHGHFAQLAFGRLAALWDLCGPLQLISTQCSHNSSQYTLHVHMQNQSGQDIHLTEHRIVDGKRSSTWTLQDQHGLTMPPINTQKEDLFAMDLDYMHNKNIPPFDFDGLFSLIDTLHKRIHHP